jgi:hypothetical protein
MIIIVIILIIIINPKADRQAICKEERRRERAGTSRSDT